LNECYKCHNTKDLTEIMINNWLDKEPPTEDYICKECIESEINIID